MKAIQIDHFVTVSFGVDPFSVLGLIHVIELR